MMYSLRLSVVFCSSQKTCVCARVCVFFKEKKQRLQEIYYSFSLRN